MGGGVGTAVDQRVACSVGEAAGGGNGPGKRGAGLDLVDAGARDLAYQGDSYCGLMPERIESHCGLGDIGRVGGEKGLQVDLLGGAVGEGEHGPAGVGVAGQAAGGREDLLEGGLGSRFQGVGAGAGHGAQDCGDARGGPGDEDDGAVCQGWVRGEVGDEGRVVQGDSGVGQGQVDGGRVSVVGEAAGCAMASAAREPWGSW